MQSSTLGQRLLWHTQIILSEISISKDKIKRESDEDRLSIRSEDQLPYDQFLACVSCEFRTDCQAQLLLLLLLTCTWGFWLKFTSLLVAAAVVVVDVVVVTALIAANFHQQLLLHIAVVVAVVMTWSLALHPWPTYDTTTTTRRQQGQKQIVKLFVNFAVRCLFAVRDCVCVCVYMDYVLSWFQGKMQFKYPIKCAYEWEIEAYQSLNMWNI